MGLGKTALQSNTKTAAIFGLEILKSAVILCHERGYCSLPVEIRHVDVKRFYNLRKGFLVFTEII